MGCVHVYDSQRWHHHLGWCWVVSRRRLRLLKADESWRDWCPWWKEYYECASWCTWEACGPLWTAHQLWEGECTTPVVHHWWQKEESEGELMNKFECLIEFCMGAVTFNLIRSWIPHWVILCSTILIPLTKLVFPGKLTMSDLSSGLILTLTTNAVASMDENPLFNYPQILKRDKVDCFWKTVSLSLSISKTKSNWVTEPNWKSWRKWINQGCQITMAGNEE